MEIPFSSAVAAKLSAFKSSCTGMLRRRSIASVVQSQNVEFYKHVSLSCLCVNGLLTIAIHTAMAWADVPPIRTVMKWAKAGRNWNMTLKISVFQRFVRRHFYSRCRRLCFDVSPNIDDCNIIQIGLQPFCRHKNLSSHGTHTKTTIRSKTELFIYMLDQAWPCHQPRP